MPRSITIKNDNGLQVSLETERLVLLAFSEADEKECRELFKNPDVMKTYGNGEPWNDPAITKWINIWTSQLKNNDPFGLFVIRKKDSKEFIGVIGFWPNKENPKKKEIFYILESKFWGKKFGSEAIEAIIQLLIPQLMLRRYTIPEMLEATALLENEPSRKILLCAGFAEKTVLKKYGKDRVLYELSIKKFLLRHHCLFSHINSADKIEKLKTPIHSRL